MNGFGQFRLVKNERNWLGDLEIFARVAKCLISLEPIERF
jgi:hypothetical protein